jgi:hypothetical protein
VDVVVFLDAAGVSFTEVGMLIPFRAYTIVNGAQHVVPFTVEYVFGEAQNTKRQALMTAGRAALAAYQQQNGLTLPAVRNVEVWGV